MAHTSFRARFAPAPTGMMHLGNIRTALLNFLIARKKGGTFIVRVEDTDQARNFDPCAEKIREDLEWLGLYYDEGPGKGGPYEPYFQSQRNEIYQIHLKELIKRGQVYRCFCTTQELEKKRNRQIALKQPPRYDRTCLTLTPEISERRAHTEPFIWRMKINQESTLTIHDLAHGTITFEMKNFSDFPLTRQDGTVTFIFANFVDDVAMKISCVIRGEDHLSNTAVQAALYQAFEAPLPTFWHLPIICSIDGKKLSKRDFGFSLRDLKEAGFLPQAIVNYLAIIGGSFEQEIMPMNQLVEELDFDHPSTTGQIKYDVEKLRWINHHWIAKLSLTELTQLCRPRLEEVYPAVSSMQQNTLEELIGHVHLEMVTLQDVVQLLAFYFAQPFYEPDIARTLVPLEQQDQAKKIIAAATQLPHLATLSSFLKEQLNGTQLKTKHLFSLVRYGLMGTPNGPGIQELTQILESSVIRERLRKLLELL